MIKAHKLLLDDGIKNNLILVGYGDAEKEYRKLIEDKYIDSYYETRLKDLNVDELLEVLRSKYGEEIILLCYEDIDMFCHRRIIADWIELKTGIYIPEVVTEHSKVKRIEPIRYTERLKRYL